MEPKSTESKSASKSTDPKTAQQAHEADLPPGMPEIPSELQRTLEQELFQRSRRVTEKDEESILQKTHGKADGLLHSVGKRVPYVRELVSRVLLLYRLLRDKDYRLQWSSKSILLGGLLYFVSPFDFFPDFVPLVGYIDDAFVVSTVINALAGEIERYMKLRNIYFEGEEEEDTEEES